MEEEQQPHPASPHSLPGSCVLKRVRAYSRHCSHMHAHVHTHTLGCTNTHARTHIYMCTLIHITHSLSRARVLSLPLSPPFSPSLSPSLPLCLSLPPSLPLSLTPSLLRSKPRKFRTTKSLRHVQWHFSRSMCMCVCVCVSEE